MQLVIYNFLLSLDGLIHQLFPNSETHYQKISAPANALYT
jgi:hypothetical protein